MIAVLAQATYVLATRANRTVRLANERIYGADPVCDGPRDVLDANGSILAIGQNLFHEPNGGRVRLGIAAVDVS